LRDIRDRPRKYAGKFITLDVWLLNVLTRDRRLVLMDWPTGPLAQWEDADSPRFPREIYYVRYDSSLEAEVLNRASPPGYKVVRIKLEVTEQVADALIKSRRNQDVSGKSTLSQICVGRLVEFLPTEIDTLRQLLPEVSHVCPLGSSLYAANCIEVKDILIKPGDFPYHDTLCVRGTVRNSGNRRLRTVWIKIYYLNQDGEPIYERMDIVTHSQAFLSGELDANKIIKPGYEVRFSCPTDDVPSGWNGDVVCVPIDVLFVR